MLDTKFLSDNLAAYKSTLKKRGSKVNIDQIIALGEKRVNLIQQIEKLRHERNQLTESLRQKPSEEIIKKGRSLKEQINANEDGLVELELELQNLLFQVPNLVSDHSPKGAEENKKVLRRFGQKIFFDFPAQDHEEIMTRLDLIDFERGAKVVGSKFYYLKNEAVLLEFALINYCLEILLKEGFSPIITPEIIKDSILKGMGFLPRGPETQMYSLENTDLSLIGTAEHTLGGMHAGENIPKEQLPLKYVGFSSCFRTEAGSYGKFSKGLYRVHQFDKVEMFIYCKPSESEEMHEYLLTLEEKIWQGLEIPYQIVDLATEDLGASAFRTFDIEAWMPGREGGSWGEVCSTSNTTDFQARLLNIKMADPSKTEFVHMLNGTAVAISRALIAICENNQNADGSISVPKVLQKYCGFELISKK